MSGRPTGLSLRLFLSSLGLAALTAVALFGTARLLAPALFDDQVERIGQRYGWNAEASPGNGPGGRGSSAEQGDGVVADELRDAFAGSLNVALLVALAVGSAAALGGAMLVSTRILRPLHRVRTAVQHMAAGNYDERVPEPADDELARLAADVNSLGGALAESERRRGRLVSDLAHELRTPITSLDGFVEGLEDGIFSPDAATLSAMRAETRRLQRLAADLGALSRADELAFDLRLEPIDLGEAAAGALRALVSSVNAAGIHSHTEALPELPVEADPDRIAQVFTNLLQNALRHTPPGGRVTIRGERRGRCAVVHVSDSGSGIAPADLPHLFERFYRGPGETSGGTGIGLTIARGIVRAHGGEVSAASPGPGGGATFSVALPLRGSRPAQPAAG